MVLSRKRERCQNQELGGGCERQQEEFTFRDFGFCTWAHLNGCAVLCGASIDLWWGSGCWVKGEGLNTSHPTWTFLSTGWWWTQFTVYRNAFRYHLSSLPLSIIASFLLFTALSGWYFKDDWLVEFSLASEMLVSSLLISYMPPNFTGLVASSVCSLLDP